MRSGGTGACADGGGSGGTAARTGSPTLPSLDVDEPALGHGEDEPGHRPGCDDRRASVGDERQGDARRRQEADVHGDVRRGLRHDVQDDEEDEHRAAPVTRVARDGETAGEEEAVEADDGGDAGESALFGEGGEDEVGMPHREEAEPALRPLLPPLPEDPARADGDTRLAHLVAGAAGGEVGVEEGPDPVLLVVLQDEPRRADRERARQDESAPDAPREASEVERREEERDVGERHAEVGLEEDEGHRERDDADERADRPGGEEGAVVVLEDPGEEEDGRDACELGRLELEAAEETDPRLRARDRRAEDREPDERQEGDGEEAGRSPQEEAVVEDGEERRHQQARDEEERLPAAQASAGRAGGRRDDHGDADAGEDERGEQERDVEAPRERLGEARHVRSPAAAGGGGAPLGGRGAPGRRRLGEGRGRRGGRRDAPGAQVRLDEARRQGGGGGAAVEAVLDEDDDDDLRVVPRGERCEPGVVPELLRKEVRLLRLLLADDLDGAGLAADVEPLDAVPVGGPPGAVHDAPEPFDDRLPRAGGVRDPLGDRRPVGDAGPAPHVLADPEEVRHRERAVGVGEAGEGARRLERRDEERALADGDGDRLARVPGVLADRLAPLRRRDRSRSSRAPRSTPVERPKPKSAGRRRRGRRCRASCPSCRSRRRRRPGAPSARSTVPWTPWQRNLRP